MKEKSCYWSTDDDEYYVTSCGANIQLVDREESPYNFCPFCGRKLDRGDKRRNKFYVLCFDRRVFL